MAKHKVVVFNTSTQGIYNGLTIRLKYGVGAINGHSPGDLAGTYTETPGGSGAYEVTVPETNIYTIEINGVVSSEYADIPLLGGDFISATRLGLTTAGNGASLVGIFDTAARISAANVEDALAELAGSGRPPGSSETIHGNAVAIAAINAIISGLSNAEVNELTGAGNTTLHKHDTLYYTETEINSTGVPNVRVTDGGSVKAVGGSVGELVVGSAPHSSTGHMGMLTIDAHTATAAKNGGKVLVDLRAGAGGQAGSFKVNYAGTEYDVITDYEVGDLDFAASTYISVFDPADDGIITRCLRELDQRVAYAIQQLTGGNTKYLVAYVREKAQTLGDISAAGTIAFGTWFATGVTVKEAVSIPLPHAEVGVRRIRIYFQAKHSTGTGGGYVRASIGGPLKTAITAINNTAFAPTYIEMDYTTAVPYPVTILLEIGNTSAGTITLQEDICVVYV